MLRVFSVAAVALLAGCANLKSPESSYTLGKETFTQVSCVGGSQYQQEGLLTSRQLCYRSKNAGLTIMINDFDKGYWQQNIYNSYTVLRAKNQFTVENFAKQCEASHGKSNIVGGSVVECDKENEKQIIAYNSVITPEGREVLAILRLNSDNQNTLNVTSQKFDEITETINHQNLKQFINYPSKTPYHGESSSFQ